MSSKYSEREEVLESSKTSLQRDYEYLRKIKLKFELPKSKAVKMSQSASRRWLESSSSTSESHSSTRTEHKSNGLYSGRRHHERHLPASSKTRIESKLEKNSSETSVETSTYLCTICNNTFKWHEQLQDHRLLHQRERKPLQCLDCKDAFWTKYHFEQHHCKPVERSSSNWRSEGSARLKYRKRSRGRFGRTSSRPTGKWLECSVCNRKFEDQMQLTEHQERRHPSEALKRSRSSGTGRRERIEIVKRTSVDDDFGGRKGRPKWSGYFSPQRFILVV